MKKIGQVAVEIATCERRIREYERAGLIHPLRDPKTGDRLFSERDVEQLRIIKDLIHKRGYTTAAIRQLFCYAPCWVLTACPHRTSCPAYSNPERPCYELRAAGVEMACRPNCQRCPIFLCRGEPRMAVVIRPSHERGEHDPRTPDTTRAVLTR